MMTFRFVLLGLFFLLPALLHAQNLALYTLSPGQPNVVNIFTGSASSTSFNIQQVGWVSTGAYSSSLSASGLQSQHSLFVYQNYLFAVNAENKSLSLFSIDPKNPANLTLLGTPQDTLFDWPNTVTANNGVACVATSGASNGVRCFQYNSGGLSALTGSDQPLQISGLITPPASHTGPAQISFTPDGKGLVISNKGKKPSLFYIPISSGVTSAPFSSPSIGGVPFGFDFDSNGDVILTDASPTGTDGGIWAVRPYPAPANNVTYLSSTPFLIQGQQAACWISRSPISSKFYVANAGSGNISELVRTGDTSFNVTNNYPTPTGLNENYISTINGADYLFQLDTATQQFFIYRISPSNVTALTTISTNNTAGGVGVAVYVVTPSTTTTTTSISSSSSSASASTTSTSSSSSTSSTSSSSSSSNSTTTTTTTTTSDAFVLRAKSELITVSLLLAIGLVLVF